MSVFKDIKTREIGALGEAVACKYLKKQGYKIRKQNYTVKGGELDIVAENREYIVFVEVKTRSADSDFERYGRPAAAITKDKRAHVRSAAREYLFRIGSQKQPRIDVIEIIINDPDLRKKDSYTLNHIENAF